MKHLKTPLAFLAAWLTLVPGKSFGTPADSSATNIPFDGLDPVKLRPLNRPGDNLFAAHRSHSSHASHASGSGGGYRAPSTPQPAPQQQRTPDSGSRSNQPTDPGRASQVSPEPAQAAPQLSLTEKRKLQIMRVQIALVSLGLYTGNVDGVLNDETKSSLKLFQNVKGLESNGLMTTETLNTLGVPAVQ